MSRKRIKKKKISKAKAMKELRRKIHKSIIDADKTAKPIELDDDLTQAAEKGKTAVLDEFYDIP